MLEVLPVQSKSEQERLCDRCGTSFLPDALAYAAYADGEFCGVCQFSLKPSGGEIYCLDPVPGHEDFQPAFVMGRAALSFLEQCGAESAVFLGKVSEENRVLVGAVGFRPDENGKYTVDLRGFFDHPCGNK